MLFYSPHYLIFFAVVFVAYWLLRWDRPRVWLLIAASFAFYATWSGTLALLVTCTTVIDYFLARGIESAPGPRQRKGFLFASLGMNIGLLCYFKYVNFFLDSLRETLHALGIESSISLLDILVPFGISFYTFEAISYTVDVYLGRIRAERNLGNFLLFILFFPHLVAGPIVRGRDFLPQITRRKRFSWLRMKLGVELFLLGLFKKLVIGDTMAGFADVLFNPATEVASLSPAALWSAVFAFSIRVYCDFSGYSDMAIGSAHLLGYKLSVNFRLPYLAVNVTDFWRRWHISLSNWIRDYLFIPLGGSHGGFWRTAFNLFVAMTLCGLWHGAAWSYVIFGMLQAVLMTGHRWFREKAETKPLLRRALTSPGGTLFRIALTYTIMSLCMVLIQPSAGRAFEVYSRLFSFGEWGAGRGLPQSMQLLILALLFALGQGLAVAGATRWASRRVPGAWLGVGYACMLSVTLLLIPQATQVFIYFQF